MKLKRSNKEPEGSIALAEAEALQQKGEKKRGQEAIGILQQASARFRDAISMGLPSEDELHDARFGSAWCLALCAEATKAAADALPDHLISRQKVEEAKHVALRLYSQAVAEYKQVLDSYGKVRSDAAVNAGNALCAVAELLVSSNSHGSHSILTEVCTPEVQAAAQAYEEARHLYQSALTRTGYEDSNHQGCSTSRSVDEEGEQDADTWCNLADCLMSYAQLLTDRKASLPQERQGEATALCQAALQAYEQACAVSDSSHGDDLPGLLCNWGSGLIAAALMTEPPRIELLHQAITQLQHSASFSRADTAPLNRLGDAWVHLAELAEAAMVHEEAKLLFTKALEEGYGRALSINRMDPEALEGAADTHAELGKLHLGTSTRNSSIESASDSSVRPQQQADQIRGQDVHLMGGVQHLVTSLQHFSSLLSQPEKVGGFWERCAVRFNCACALAVSGREEECCELLTQLASIQGLRTEDLIQDLDLANVRPKQWFKDLLAAIISSQ